MRMFLTAALMLSGSLANAEGKDVDVSTAADSVKVSLPQPPDRDGEPVKQKVSANDSKSPDLKSALEDLNARQKAEITAVNLDSSKTPEQKRAALSRIHEDFRLKRSALRAQSKADGGRGERPAVDTAKGSPPPDNRPKP